MSKLTESAKGQTCIRCGAPPDTVRACHYNGIRQLSFGKGMGKKCDDLATAEFCAQCDAMFSEGVMPPHYGTVDRVFNKLLRSEEFLYYVMLTNIRRRERGIL